MSSIEEPAHVRGFKVWNKDEEMYLEENWGTISIPTIAKNLGRTVNAIKVRASRLGLGPCLLGGEYISFNQLVIALTGHNSHSYHLISWVKNRGLQDVKQEENNEFLRSFSNDGICYSSDYRRCVQLQKSDST